LFFYFNLWSVVPTCLADTPGVGVEAKRGEGGAGCKPNTAPCKQNAHNNNIDARCSTLIKKTINKK
jgi:hypothetical protein